MVMKAAEDGRRYDAATIDLALLVQDHFEWVPHKTRDGSARRMFTGTSADMAADAAALSAIGIRHVALRLGGDTVEASVERVERFGAEVIAKMRA